MDDVQERPPKPPVKPYRHAKFLPDLIQGKGEPAPSQKSTGVMYQKFAELSPTEQWDELVGALHLHRRRLLRIPGVTAVDVGYRIDKRKFTNTLALRVHVERKLPEEARDTVFKDRLYDYIPKDGGDCKEPYVGPRGCSVPMDVIEAAYMPAQFPGPHRPRMVPEKPLNPEDVHRRRRLDPLVGGISIGSPQAPAGTLGTLVWDRVDGSVCILSNWHVLSGDPQTEAGNPTFQPGLFDQGRSSDVVARLKRWSFDSQTDAALAELTGSRNHCAGEIVSFFQQISGSTDPYLGMTVLKSGRSTGRTWGFVDGLYFSSVIQYSNGVMQVFEDQIHIAPVKPNVRISEDGDSGSIWVTETTRRGYEAVGLHFAGDLPHSAFGEYALANPMRIVQERLDFSFRPLFLELRDEDVCSPRRLDVQSSQIRHGNGSQPSAIVLNGLTGSGTQPDQVKVGSGG